MVGPLSRVLAEEDWNCEGALVYDLAKDKTLVVWGVKQCGTLWGHPTGLSNKQGVYLGNGVRAQHRLENVIM